jgi:tRNA(Ile)-lysidine synthase
MTNSTKTEKKQPSLSLPARIEKVIRNHDLLQREATIIIGVSGGADSLALLHILHALNYNLQLITAYIDHGLRPEEIITEKKTIKEHCRRLHIPFVVESVNVQEYGVR